MLIYIVEDDTDIRELETYALKNSGYEVKSFGESKSFFKACAEIKPQLVILDVMLPDFDGLSVLEKLRKDKSTKNIPVILVTAKSSEMDKVKGLDMGADDYITKPFNPGLVKRQHIGVTFHQITLVQSRNVALGLVNTVQGSAFVVDFRLG